MDIVIQPKVGYNAPMKNNPRLYIFLAFVALTHLVACVSPTAPRRRDAQREAAIFSGRAYAYDGDSVFFGRVEVRLEGIDAPELKQACRDARGAFWPCGKVARDRLRELMGGGRVSCSIASRDKYRQLLGTCYAGGRDLNAAMVESGNAVAYHQFSEKYTPEEERAKARHSGIWQDDDFTKPFFCRHLKPGHDCYAYDEDSGTGMLAHRALTGKSDSKD